MPQSAAVALAWSRVTECSRVVPFAQLVPLGFVPGRGLKRNSPSVTDGHQWQLAQDGLDRHDVEYGELPFHNLVSYKLFFLCIKYSVYMQIFICYAECLVLRKNGVYLVFQSTLGFIS